MVVMGKKHIECSCRECVAACRHHPGALMPGDLKRLTRFLGLTEQQLFKKHIAVLDLGENRLPFPAARYLPAGRVTKYTDDRWSLNCWCHWLNEDGLCDVHEAKPTECAEVVPHNRLPCDGHDPRRIAIYRAWARPENRLRLAKLLGEED